MAKLLPDGPIDTLGYLDTVLGRPERVDDVLASGPVEGLVAATEIDHVVVATSAALVSAADLVAVLAGPVSPIPVLALGVAPLPAAVGPRSLVVALGIEPAQAATARERGAAVVELAGQEAHLPRLGASGAALRTLLVLEQLGLHAGVSESASAAVTQLGRRRDQLGPDAPPLRTLARRIGRTLPIVYGTDALGGAAASSWKRQINLSAKVASFAGRLPEVATAEIAGWGQHGDMTRQVFSLVELRHDHEPAGTAALVDRTDALVDEVVHERHVLAAEGNGPMAQLFDLVFQGDVFAYHLAQELEVDPGPTAAVDALR